MHSRSSSRRSGSGVIWLAFILQINQYLTEVYDLFQVFCAALVSMTAKVFYAAAFYERNLVPVDEFHWLD